MQCVEELQQEFNGQQMSPFGCYWSWPAKNGHDLLMGGETSTDQWPISKPFVVGVKYAHYTSQERIMSWMVLTSIEWIPSPSLALCSTRTSTWCCRWNCWPGVLGGMSPDCSCSPATRPRSGSPSDCCRLSSLRRWVPRRGARNICGDPSERVRFYYDVYLSVSSPWDQWVKCLPCL